MKNSPERLYRPAGPPPPEFLCTPRGHKKSAQYCLRHDRSTNPHTVPLNDRGFLKRAAAQAKAQQRLHKRADKRAQYAHLSSAAQPADLQSLVLHFQTK